MIEFELLMHLKSKTNARGMHWATRQHKPAKYQRTQAKAALERELEAHTRTRTAFTREVVSKGKNGRRLKKPYTRNILIPEWTAALNAGMTVTFTRHAPRKLDSADNMRDSFKSIKDGIADALGIDDSDRETRVTWLYQPEVKSQVAKAVIAIDWKDPA